MENGLKWQDMFVEVVRVVARHIAPLLVGALLGILADAGLLDGAVSDAVRQVPVPSGSWLSR